MNMEFDARKHLEATITSAVKHDPAVVGAILVGSIANGTSDRFSDLDFYLYVEGSWWSDHELAKWIKDAGLALNLHYWTGVAKHHLLVNGERVDFTIWSEHDQAEIACWPHLFFPSTSIIKDEQGRLRDAYEANPQSVSHKRLNDYSAYVLNLMIVAAQLCRGEEVNGRNRFMSVVEAKARLLQDLPFGTALWREPTRHIEENLPTDQVEELRGLAFIARDQLARWVAEELDLASKDDALDPDARAAAWSCAQQLQKDVASQRHDAL